MASAHMRVPFGLGQVAIGPRFATRRKRIGVQIPRDRVLGGAGGEERFPIGAEGEGAHRADMPEEARPHLLPAGHIPKHHALVFAAGGERLSIGRKGEPYDRPAMTG